MLGGSDIALTIEVPLSASATNGATIVEAIPAANGTPVDDGRTQFDSPHDDIV